MTQRRPLRRWNARPDPSRTIRGAKATAESHVDQPRNTDSGLVPVILVLLSVLFNAALAIVNGHFFPPVGSQCDCS
jgi:hypothetical protein